ncbi:hypothetical protein FHX57_007205 [Paraburkholderia tropica]|uniref:Secreted protein n=1 Tax=Paraburkholderia tropica TaxID=92647 RepID=A0AAQ1JYN6_9BURK|nr:hypothetical protein [Paraburkholderia tropica]MBB2983952.1 hypothetical protein [Paraburkholderia tropica]MBB3004819.1 hypothetical protein [Paraburkholderia tropica]MBB6323775.1 hypothetical protein [Paraburkholderia tropica]PXX07959.1 hypothetical protein C7400_128110 [Paraburkholderia tropica]PZW73379.1 hypothetical protein C7399_128110 [Paraburkholderia tropica]
MQSTRYPAHAVVLRHTVATCLASLLLASAGCAAQPQPEATPVPPPPPSAAIARPPGAAPLAPLPGTDPGRPAEPGIATGSTAQGTVARFLINPDGDVDGFLTREGLLIRFPPHMGAQLAATVRKGDAVQVSGWRNSEASLDAQRITDTRSGEQLVDQPPAPDAAARPMPRELRGAGLSPMDAQGQVAYVTSAPRGEPDGVILSDGTVIKLTPPIAQQYPALVRTGATVAARGYGTRNQYGAALQATAFGSPGNLSPLYDRLPPAP